MFVCVCVCFFWLGGSGGGVRGSGFRVWGLGFGIWGVAWALDSREQDRMIFSAPPAEVPSSILYGGFPKLG